MTKEQVRQLGQVADRLNYPVIKGIRTDFRGELFEGSAEPLALADNLIELKPYALYAVEKQLWSLEKMTRKAVTEGSKVVVGGNDIYMPVCRKKHYRKLTKLI